MANNMTTAVVGMKVLDKVARTRNVITEVTETEMSMQQIDYRDEPIEDAEIVTLPLSAMKVMDVFYDPKQDEIPEGYTVKDGILFKWNEPATEQGQLVFIDVLAKIKGKILLTAVPKSKAEDAVEVFAYDPLADKFSKIVREVSSVRVIKEMSNDYNVIMQILNIENRVAVDDDGNDVKDKDGNKIIVPVVTELAIASYDVTGDISFENVSYTVGKIIPVAGQESMFVVQGEQLLGYDEYGLSVLKDVENGVTAMLVIASAGYNLKLTVRMPEEIVDATIDVNGDLILRTKNSLYVENRGYNARTITTPLLANLDGYKYLVDKDIRNGSESYNLANDNYDVATIKKTKTYDRGDIFTIVE